MNSVHPEDSLDNLSNLQLNRQKQLFSQVKQQFSRGLEKLQTAETREIAITELKKLIEHYRQQEYLRGYLAILKTLKSNSNSATKEHQILVVSILAQTYKDQLLDTLDKPPSLLKSAFRVVQILHSYFNDHSPTVQQACARALLDVNTHCLSGQTIQTVFSITYAPLISILKSGVDKGSQATASACLSQLIKFNRKTGAEDILKRLSPELLSAILRINSEYHQLFQAILGMIESQGLSFLEGKLVAFLAKMLSVIDGTREMQNTNTTNLNAYMCKVNVCKMIEKIGRLLPQAEKEKLFQLRIPEALQQAARHRIIQVQLAASKALKAWKGEELEEESPLKTRGLMNLEEKRNSLKAERSRSKEDRAKAESELTFMKEDLEKMVKGGWGASNRAKNYVKRGTGVGGGHISRSQLSPLSKSGGKSHKEHLEQLREFIKKGAENNKHIDKFIGLIGTEYQKINKSTSPQPNPRSKSPSARGRSPEKISPPSRGKSQGSQGKKKQKAVFRSDEDDEFGMVEDEGDQMVYTPQPPSSLKPKASQPKNQQMKEKSRFEDIGMTQSEAMELMADQKALLNEGREMNINFTQISEEDRHQKKDFKQNQANGVASIVEYLPLRETNKLYTPSEPEPKSRTFQQQKQEAISVFKRISQEEVGELVQQYNLSQVSENLNDVLTESDLIAFQSSNVEMIDSNILEPTQGKSEIDAIKEIMADKKQKKSAVSKFFKKQPQAEILQKEEAKMQNQKKELLTSKQNLDHPAISLNFTESQESKVKSPSRREDIQFTLNPKEKFSIVKDLPRGNEKQIEEEIVMSEYEESFPRDSPLPIILPKIAPITQIPLRHSLYPENIEKQEKLAEKRSSPRFRKEVEKKEKMSPPPTFQLRDQIRQEPAEAKRDYQSLISNPPRTGVLNEHSRLKASKATEKSYPEKSRLSQEYQESESIGSTWLSILDKIHEGEVNQAYDMTLELDDPIYLLRLMLLSKMPVKKLSPETFQAVWKRFMQIYSQRFIDVLTVGLLSEGHDLGILSKSLSVEQLQEAMVGLYELSGSSRGKLSYKAANLYNEIDKKLHPE